VIEYVPKELFITHFRASVSVLVGPCCPALLNCIVLTSAGSKVQVSAAYSNTDEPSVESTCCRQAFSRARVGRAESVCYDRFEWRDNEQRAAMKLYDR